MLRPPCGLRSGPAPDFPPERRRQGRATRRPAPAPAGRRRRISGPPAGCLRWSHRPAPVRWPPPLHLRRKGLAAAPGICTAQACATCGSIGARKPARPWSPAGRKARGAVQAVTRPVTCCHPPRHLAGWRQWPAPASASGRRRRRSSWRPAPAARHSAPLVISDRRAAHCACASPVKMLASSMPRSAAAAAASPALSRWKPPGSPSVTPSPDRLRRQRQRAASVGFFEQDGAHGFLLRGEKGPHAGLEDPGFSGRWLRSRHPESADGRSRSGR